MDALLRIRTKDGSEVSKTTEIVSKKKKQSKTLFSNSLFLSARLNSCNFQNINENSVFAPVR